jgi:uncharacterized membrane protein YraQ (UPF0718 family)
MSNEAFDWLVVTAAICAAVAVASTIGAIIESWLEWKREREQRLPDPEWRARVTRRWGVPE